MLDTLYPVAVLCNADSRTSTENDGWTIEYPSISEVVKNYEKNFGKVAAYDSIRKAWNV